MNSYNREIREDNIADCLYVIDSLSYLNDERVLKKYVSERKEELKKNIKLFQTLTVEEILVEQGYIYPADIANPRLLNKLEMIKEDAAHYSKENDDWDYFFGKTANEIIKLSDQELIEFLIDEVNKQNEEAKKEIQEQKERYAGITEEELEEYVDLLVQKEVLESKMQLKFSEMNLEYLEKHPRKYDIEIHSIEQLDLEMQELKESRKENMKALIKLISIFGGSVSILALIATKDLFLSLISAVSAVAAVVGLVGAIQGSVFLALMLRNQKIEKKLKEKGVYDLYLKRIGVEKQIEQFGEEKGLVN